MAILRAQDTDMRRETRMRISTSDLKTKANFEKQVLQDRKTDAPYRSQSHSEVIAGTQETQPMNLLPEGAEGVTFLSTNANCRPPTRPERANSWRSDKAESKTVR